MMKKDKHNTATLKDASGQIYILHDSSYGRVIAGNRCVVQDVGKVRGCQSCHVSNGPYGRAITTGLQREIIKMPLVSRRPMMLDDVSQLHPRFRCDISHPLRPL